jgi:hypothetical protein
MCLEVKIYLFNSVYAVAKVGHYIRLWKLCYSRECNFNLICRNKSDITKYFLSNQPWCTFFIMSVQGHNDTVACGPVCTQRPKYAKAAIEGRLEEVLSMRSAPCPLLGGGPVDMYSDMWHVSRLLRLAGQRWKYSTPPPHRILPILSKSRSN